MNIRDNLLIDFEKEIDNVDFNDSQKCDNSYQLMYEQIIIQFKDRKSTDKSLKQQDIIYIIDVLNDTQLELRDAYFKIVEFLENKKCVMSSGKRKKYFYKITKDLGIYLMRALDMICEGNNTLDYYEIATSLGMCNSEALDFLDAYCDENGWIEEKGV